MYQLVLTNGVGIEHTTALIRANSVPTSFQGNFDLINSIDVDIERLNPSFINECEYIAPIISNIRKIQLRIRGESDFSLLANCINQLFNGITTLDELSIDIGFHDGHGILLKAIKSLKSVPILTIGTNGFLANPDDEPVVLDTVTTLVLFSVHLRNGIKPHFFYDWQFPKLTKLVLRRIFLSTDVLKFIYAHGPQLESLELNTMTHWTAEILRRCPSLTYLILDVFYNTNHSLSHSTIRDVGLRGIEKLNYWHDFTVARFKNTIRNICQKDLFPQIRRIHLLDFKRYYFSTWGASISIISEVVQQCKEANITLVDSNGSPIDNQFLIQIVGEINIKGLLRRSL